MSPRGGRIVVRLTVAVAALSGLAALLVVLLAGAPLAMGTLGVAATILSSALLARVVLRVQLEPLGKLDRRLHALEQDDWSDPGPGTAELRSDELGRLAAAFEELFHTLKTKRARLEDEAAGLERRVAERTLHLEEANRRLSQLDQGRERVLEGVARHLAEPLDELGELLREDRIDEDLDPQTLGRVIDAADRMDRALSLLRS